MCECFFYHWLHDGYMIILSKFYKDAQVYVFIPKKKDWCSNVISRDLSGHSLKGSVGVDLVELLQNTTKPYFMHYSCVCNVCSLTCLSKAQRFAEALTGVHRNFCASAPNWNSAGSQRLHKSQSHNVVSPIVWGGGIPETGLKFTENTTGAPTKMHKPHWGHIKHSWAFSLYVN